MVMLLVQLAVAVPHALDELGVLVPEHGTVIDDRYILDGRRAGDGLPDLERKHWPRHQREVLHRRAPIWNARYRDLEILSGERELLVVQRAADDLHLLLEVLSVLRIVGRLLGVVVGPHRNVALVEMLYLTRHRAAADAEDATATAQVVHRREVLGEAHRVPLRNDVEHRAQPNSIRASSDPSVEQQTVRDDFVTLVLEVVFGGPEAVVAERIGSNCGLDVLQRCVPARGVVEVAIHRVRLAGPGVVHLDAAEEERSQFHLTPVRKNVALRDTVASSRLGCQCRGFAPACGWAGRKPSDGRKPSPVRRL